MNLNRASAMSGNTAFSSLSLFRLHFHSLETSHSSHSHLWTSSQTLLSNQMQLSSSCHRIYKPICVGLHVLCFPFTCIRDTIPLLVTQVLYVFTVSRASFLQLASSVFLCIGFSCQPTNMLCYLPALIHMQMYVSMITKYV